MTVSNWFVINLDCAIIPDWLTKKKRILTAKLTIVVGQVKVCIMKNIPPEIVGDLKASKFNKIVTFSFKFISVKLISF